jgi:hypothetical protein
LDVQRETIKRRSGDPLSVEIRRADETRELSVTLGELPDPPVPVESQRIPVPPRAALQRVQPPVVYAITPDGRISPAPPLIAITPEQAQMFQQQFNTARAAPPATAPATIVVQRSELDQKLENLTRAVEALQKQVGQLSRELNELTERLRK